MLASNINGAGRSKVVYLVKLKPDSLDLEAFGEVKQNRHCVLIHHSSSDMARVKKKAEYVTGVNPKYAFEISRNVGSQKWAIEQVDIGGDGSNLALAYRRPLRQTAQMFCCEHFSVWGGLTLEKLIDRPNFRATKTERVTIDGVGMVRIDFESPYPVEKRKEPGFSPIQGGYLILDPEHYWCLKEYTVRTNDSSSRRTYWRSFDYTDGRDHFPLVRASKAKTIGYHPDGTDWFVTEHSESDEYRQTDGESDDGEFTLSAFGLPEPVGITWKKPTPRYVWFLIAAGSFALLALAFRFIARRCKTANSSP